MDPRVRVGAAIAATVLLFLGVMFGALALVEPFDAADYQAVEDPENPLYSALFLLAILLATGVMLVAIKLDARWVIQSLVVAASALLGWLVLAAIVPPLVSVGGVNPLPLVGALAIAAGLVWYPEWWVVDAAGVLMGAGAAGLLGISLGILPVLVFLIALAVYDAISVYRTGHMLTLAEGVMDLNLPVVLVVPTTRSFSLRRDATDGTEPGPGDALGSSPVDGTEGDPETELPTEASTVENHTPAEERRGVKNGTGPDGSHVEAAPTDRGALFIGLGDAVMPAILVASATAFVDAPIVSAPVVSPTIPAVGAIVGTVLGLLVLMALVLRGRAHAGLPMLNGGAIAGYLVGGLASGIGLTAAIGL